jgi:hypothetical protein
MVRTTQRALRWAALLGQLATTPAIASSDARAQSCEVQAPASGPVSILILDSPRRVDEFAGSVQGVRVVAREAGTVIFEDGRVVTADADAASRQLNALGWGKRSIQIVAGFPLHSAAPARRRG